MYNSFVLHLLILLFYRFEKEWLADANNVFIRKMDIDVRHMLAPSCSEIMIDVLQRFDNRPETGIFVSHKSGNKFVRTIPTVADLIHLLRYMMRQSALDNINKWTRTALHLACDMNKVESHQQVILRLVDYHGANVHIRDIHGRTPMQLLIQDKDPGNNPSATKLREEAIIDRRESHLVTLFKAFDEEEKASMLKRQKKILDECIERENMMSKRLWEATRLASIFVRKYNNWEMYQDPDSENFFYVQIPDNAFAGDTYDNFSWTLPETINAQVHRMDALAYIKHYKARMVRKVANWEMYQGLMDPFNFYYDPETEQLTFAVPREVSWPLIFRKGKKNMDNYGYAEKLGYANEWEVHTDADGNSFYLNTVTRQCEWEKPIDAVIPSPLEKLCTAHQHKGKSIEQKWYSCEQCNRAWKSSSEGNTKTVKLCEPCVFRCHKGHKGIRYIRTSAALCSCSDACKVTNSICKACQISDIQQKKQQESYGYSIEQKRKALHDLNTPLVLAMIPRLLPNGTAKTVSGWHFCRKVPQQITDTLKSPDFFTTYPSDPNFNRSKPYSDTDSDDSDVLVIVDPSIKLLSEAEHNNTLYCVEGLPPDWIHVYDVEEPEDLKFGDRVLCLRYSGLPRVYGTIRSAVRRGYYRIRYDDDHLQDEVLERSHIECLSRDTFFCNLKTGQSVWSIDDVDDETKYHNSCTLTLSGPDWFDIHRDSTLKRVFKDWDEMINHPLNFSYFLRPGHLLVEKAILQVQINARIKLRFPRRFTPWISTAFTFDIPSTVWLEKKERAGWAYLRRRSTNVGEVLDVDGAEWDEYMDSKTAEHFYWEEEENLYRWDKPELFKRPDKKQIETLPIGEEVLYRFPGRRGDENAFVTKVRFDDETGEDMYDLQHKYNQELSECVWSINS